MRGREARASGGTAPGVGHPAGPRLPPVVQRAGRRGTPAVQRLGRGGAARARRANLRAGWPSGPVPDPARVRASRSAGVRGAPGPGPRASRSARRGAGPTAGLPGRKPPGASATQRAAWCLRDPAGGAGQAAQGLSASAARRLSGPAVGGAGCPAPQPPGAWAAQRAGWRGLLCPLSGPAERLCSAAPVRWSGVAEGAGAAAPAGLFPGSVSPYRARRRGPRIPQRPPLGRGPRPGRRPGSVRRGREWPGAHAQVPCDQGREGSPGHIQGGPEPAAR